MDNTEERLISKYIIRHYPVIKIKAKKRFKRGIQIIKTMNGETSVDNLFLKKEENAHTIREHIINDISKVFGFSREKVKDIVTNYVYRS